MLSDMKIPFAALILLAGVVAISAESREVIQNERSIFIQDQSGAWHQYKRMRRKVAPLPVFAQAPGARRRSPTITTPRRLVVWQAEAAISFRFGEPF
jgi:hypothetical protein